MVFFTSWPPAVLQGCSNNQVIRTYMCIKQSGEKEEGAGNNINQSARADDVHHDHIIPKPWLMKRISHMVLAHNASHLLQGLSGLSRPVSRQNSLLVSLCTSNVACFRLFSRHFLIFISRWAPHACAMPSSSFMETRPYKLCVSSVSSENLLASERPHPYLSPPAPFLSNEAGGWRG